MNKLEEIINTSDDSNIGYFPEVDLVYTVHMKQKRIFLFVLKIKLFLKIKIMNIWKR